MIEAEKRIREALADEALRDEGASVNDTLYAAHVFEEVCSPENIAALLAEIDRLRAAVQHEADCVEAYRAQCETLTRERDEARAELERERMRLVACGVVAMSNTSESAERNREMHADYRSASCDDVARAVDREMALRAERDALAKDAAIGRVVWRFIDRMTDVCDTDPAERIVREFVDAVYPAIEAALAPMRAQIEQEKANGSR